MGHMVGMPCMKLNNVGRKSASCGSFAAVALEALEERQGRDPDIDRELTSDNLYTGYRTAEELMEYSRQHVAELSEQQRAEGGRGIRSDAVVMCVTVVKPPAAYMATLTREEQIRLLKDADELLDELIGGPQNSKSSVYHFDELGGHLHKFWEPMTDDGRLCAKERMNLKFFAALNKRMPEHLRSRGWDIDDCRAYDEAKEQLKTEQEKAEERRRRGLTSVQYKAQAEAEKNRLCEEIDNLQAKANELEEKAKAKTAEFEAAEAARKKAAEEEEAATERTKELTSVIQTLEEYNSAADKAEEVVKALESSERGLEQLRKIPELVPFYSRKKASTAIQEAIDALKKPFAVARELIARLIGFEAARNMPKEKRRSPKLAERIERAAAISHGRDNSRRDVRDHERG